MSLPTITTNIATATVATPEAQNTSATPLSIWKQPSTHYDLAKFLIPMAIAFLLAVVGYFIKQDAQARDVDAIKTQIATYPAIREQRIQQITQLQADVKTLQDGQNEEKADIKEIQRDIKTLLQMQAR